MKYCHYYIFLEWYHKVEFWNLPYCQDSNYFKFMVKHRIDNPNSPKRHTVGSLNYFLVKKTNAISEGFDSKISLIKNKAGSSRNMVNLKNMIYFCIFNFPLYSIIQNKQRKIVRRENRMLYCDSLTRVRILIIFLYNSV